MRSKAAPLESPSVVTPAGRPEAEETVEPVAVFVCHGMGQQVPFETIDSVARVLRKAVASENPGIETPDIEVDLVPLPGSEWPLARAALQFKATDGNSRVVHVYETYWAPLTEGRVTLRDVMSFLFTAGIGGLSSAIRSKFWRLMFGEWKDCGRPVLAPFLLALALLVVISLVVMNSTILAVAASRSLTQGRSTWPSDALVADITITFLVLLSTTIILAVIFWLARWRHRKHEEANEGWTLRDSWLRLWLALSVIAVWVTIAVAIGVGFLLVVQINWHLEDANTSSMWWNRSNWLAKTVRDLILASLWELAAPPPDADRTTAQRIFVAAVWGLLAVASYQVRKLLVQYAGDVAAYVSAHEASKFCDIRAGIQKAALDVAKWS